MNIAIIGPGEQGLAFYLSPEDEKIKDALYKVNGFNALVSDRINLNRTLKDIRHPEYVILFHNFDNTFVMASFISVVARRKII